MDTDAVRHAKRRDAYPAAASRTDLPPEASGLDQNPQQPNRPQR